MCYHPRKGGALHSLKIIGLGEWLAEEPICTIYY
jgi:hypothetical protein